MPLESRDVEVLQKVPFIDMTTMPDTDRPADSQPDTSPSQTPQRRATTTTTAEEDVVSSPPSVLVAGDAECG
jgi:hypothetical protein